jgi:hypothetical protein
MLRFLDQHQLKNLEDFFKLNFDERKRLLNQPA